MTPKAYLRELDPRYLTADSWEPQPGQPHLLTPHRLIGQAVRERGVKFARDLAKELNRTKLGRRFPLKSNDVTYAITLETAGRYYEDGGLALPPPARGDKYSDHELRAILDARLRLPAVGAAIESAAKTEQWLMDYAPEDPKLRAAILKAIGDYNPRLGLPEQVQRELTPSPLTEWRRPHFLANPTEDVERTVRAAKHIQTLLDTGRDPALYTPQTPDETNAMVARLCKLGLNYFAEHLLVAFHSLTDRDPQTGRPRRITPCEPGWRMQAEHEDVHRSQRMAVAASQESDAELRVDAQALLEIVDAATGDTLDALNRPYRRAWPKQWDRAGNLYADRRFNREGNRYRVAGPVHGRGFHFNADPTLRDGARRALREALTPKTPRTDFTDALRVAHLNHSLDNDDELRSALRHLRSSRQQRASELTQDELDAYRQVEGEIESVLGQPYFPVRRYDGALWILHDGQPLILAPGREADRRALVVRLRASGLTDPDALRALAGSTSNLPALPAAMKHDDADPSTRLAVTFGVNSWKGKIHTTGELTFGNPSNVSDAKERKAVEQLAREGRVEILSRRPASKGLPPFIYYRLSPKEAEAQGLPKRTWTRYPSRYLPQVSNDGGRDWTDGPVQKTVEAAQAWTDRQPSTARVPSDHRSRVLAPWYIDGAYAIDATKIPRGSSVADRKGRDKWVFAADQPGAFVPEPEWITGSGVKKPPALPGPRQRSAPKPRAIASKPPPIFPPQTAEDATYIPDGRAAQLVDYARSSWSSKYGLPPRRPPEHGNPAFTDSAADLEILRDLERRGLFVVIVNDPHAGPRLRGSGGDVPYVYYRLSDHEAQTLELRPPTFKHYPRAYQAHLHWTPPGPRDDPAERSPIFATSDEARFWILDRAGLGAHPYAQVVAPWASDGSLAWAEGLGDPDGPAGAVIYERTPDGERFMHSWDFEPRASLLLPLDAWLEERARLAPLRTWEKFHAPPPMTKPSAAGPRNRPTERQAAKVTGTVLRYSLDGGVTLTGDTKPHREGIKRAGGWRWSRRQGFWYRPRTRGQRFTRSEIARLADHLDDQQVPVDVEYQEPPALSESPPAAAEPPEKAIRRLADQAIRRVHVRVKAGQWLPLAVGEELDAIGDNRELDKTVVRGVQDAIDAAFPDWAKQALEPQPPRKPERPSPPRPAALPPNAVSIFELGKTDDDATDVARTLARDLLAARGWQGMPPGLAALRRVSDGAFGEIDAQTLNNIQHLVGSNDDPNTQRKVTQLAAILRELRSDIAPIVPPPVTRSANTSPRTDAWADHTLLALLPDGGSAYYIERVHDVPKAAELVVGVRDGDKRARKRAIEDALTALRSHGVKVRARTSGDSIAVYSPSQSLPAKRAAESEAKASRAQARREREQAKTAKKEAAALARRERAEIKRAEAKARKLGRRAPAPKLFARHIAIDHVTGQPAPMGSPGASPSRSLYYVSRPERGAPLSYVPVPAIDLAPLHTRYAIDPDRADHYRALAREAPPLLPTLHRDSPPPTDETQVSRYQRSRQLWELSDRLEAALVGAPANTRTVLRRRLRTVRRWAAHPELVPPTTAANPGCAFAAVQADVEALAANPSAYTLSHGSNAEPEGLLTLSGAIAGDSSIVAVPTARSGPSLIPARFAVVDAETLIPSHNPQGFDPRADYPDNTQERRYERDPGEKLKVTTIAQRMVPQLLANTNAGATDGTPIVTPGGIVLSGNGRTMGVQLHYRGGRDDLRTWLLDNSAQFGLTPGDIARVERPIVVRVIDPGETTSLSRLVRDFNVSLTQALAETDETQAQARQLPPELPQILADGDAGDGLLPYLGSPRSKPLVAALERSGWITRSDRNRKLTPDGLLTPAARKQVAALITASASTDAAMASPTLAKSLDRSAPYWLVAAAAGPQWDLRVPLARATTDYLSLRHAGACLLQWRQQQTLTDDAERHSDGDPAAELLLEILELAAARPVIFARIASKYADAAAQARGGGGLFGPPTTDPLTALQDAALAAGVKPASALSRRRCKKP